MKIAQPTASVFTFLLLLCVSALSVTAQQTKTFAVHNFSEIQVSSGIDLYLTQGNSESVKLVADDDLLKNVIIDKSGSNLIIKYKSNNGWGFSMKNRSVKAYVSYKTLVALRTSGGSDVFSTNPVRTNRFSISSSGGSDVKLELVVNDLQIQSSGGADIILKGRAKNMEINSSGGSDVNAYNLVVENARVNSSGGADVEIHVTRALEASASGGSDISFRGDAALKNNSSKSGNVKRVS